MPDLDLLRRPPAASLSFAAVPGRVEVEPAEALSRFAVRGDREVAGLIGRAFGVELPTEPLRFVAQNERTALWLGPDEWLLLAQEGDGPDVRGQIAAAAGPRPYSLVDVSHRNAGFKARGRNVSEALNAGCPLPLDRAAFPVGKCTRTLFGKAEIVLWRVEEAAFRIEVWRSFAAYVAGLLSEAAREHLA